MKGADWLGDQDAIHYMCREAPETVIEVRLDPRVAAHGSSSTLESPFPVRKRARSINERSAANL